jgi:upstream activation factor subunit UAF30
MPKSTSGGSSRSRGAKREPEEKSQMETLVDAVKAHPVAAAAALAAGGMAVAGLARRGRSSKPVAEKAKQPAKRPAKRAAKAGGAPRAAGGGLARKVQPDATLAAVIGGEALTRADITKRMWDYIKQNGLQDATNRRMINADTRLRGIFGKDQVSMFEMTRLVNQHVSDAA